MRTLNKSKNALNKEFFSNNKCYFIFTFFNINQVVIDLLRMTIEDDYGLKVFKVEKKYNLVNIFLEFDLKDYIEYKSDLIDFFENENFKFCLTAIYYNKNYIQPLFFETEFLLELDEFELNDELIFFIYLKILNNFVEKKKLIFFFYNLIFLNKNLFLYNVYNTSSSF